MERFKATTTWHVLKIESEPYLIMTYRGYAFAVVSRDLSTNREHELVITNIKSLATPLEELRQSNGGLFKGLRFGIKKESEERSSKYVLDPEKAVTNTIKCDEIEESLHTGISPERKLWQRISKRYH